MPRRRRRTGRLRRGGSTTGLIVTLACFIGFGGAAVLIGPQLLSAGDAGEERRVDQLPAVPERRLILESLATMIESSEAVLAVDARRSTPMYEIILWARDIEDPGTIEADELIIISHSRLLSAVTVHMTDGSASPEDDADSGEPQHFTARETRSRGFADRFRKRADVEARTVGTGISDVALDPAESETAGAGGRRFSLTWSAETSDGSDVGWVWLQGPMRAARDQSTGAPG